MKTLKLIWTIMVGLLYLGVVIAVLSAVKTTFEILVLAGIVLVYSATLYNASALAVAMDANNFAGYVRFRVLAAAQGVTHTEEGSIQETEEALGAAISAYQVPLRIRTLSNSAASLYALFKIAQVLFF